MPLFESKPKVIDAVQFVDEKNPPRGVKRAGKEFGGEFYVTTIQDINVVVQLGEWIVDEGDHVHFYPIADEVFRGPKGYSELPI